MKPVLSSHSKIDKTKVWKPCGSLKQVKSTAECSTGSILQYFWPALSDHPSWKPIFWLSFEWSLKTGFTVLTNKRLFLIENFLIAVFNDATRWLRVKSALLYKSQTNIHQRLGKCRGIYPIGSPSTYPICYTWKRVRKTSCFIQLDSP